MFKNIVKSLMLILIVALATAGCGTIGALFHSPPDARFAANKADMDFFVGKDPDPVDKPRGDKAKERAGGLEHDYAPPEVTGPNGSPAPLDGPGLLTSVGGLLTSIPGLTAVGGFLTAIGGLWLTIKNGQKTKVVASAVGQVATAVDQHAALIDSVTPEAADFAAKTTTVVAAV